MNEIKPFPKRIVNVRKKLMCKYLSQELLDPEDGDSFSRLILKINKETIKKIGYNRRIARLMRNNKNR